MIKVEFDDRLEEKLFGKRGHDVFVIGGAGWSVRGEKRAPQTELSLYHYLQNGIYTVVNDYMRAMRNLSEDIYMTYDRNAEYESPEPIGDNFFNRMLKGGKIVVGEFGNKSPHAKYFEWGTGPVGAANVGNLSRTTLERYGAPTYRDSPWVYFNEALGHCVTTSGMAPRPFVVPAFLQLKTAMKNALDRLCKTLATDVQAGMYASPRAGGYGGGSK